VPGIRRSLRPCSWSYKGLNNRVPTGRAPPLKSNGQWHFEQWKPDDTHVFAAAIQTCAPIQVFRHIGIPKLCECPSLDPGRSTGVDQDAQTVGVISIQFLSIQSRHSLRFPRGPMVFHPSGTGMEAGQRECWFKEFTRTRNSRLSSSKGLINSISFPSEITLFYLGTMTECAEQFLQPVVPRHRERTIHDRRRSRRLQDWGSRPSTAEQPSAEWQRGFPRKTTK